MSLIRFLIIIFIFFCSFKQDCGKERFDVKTLSDKESKLIKWIPIKSNVKFLSQLNQDYPIDKKFNKNVRFGYEFNVYEIKCRITDYKKDQNGDYSLTLVDIKDNNCTIIGKVVNPLCTDIGKNNNYFNTFLYVRSEFEKITISQDKVKTGTYVVTGVYFKNTEGTTLHPIMDIFPGF